MLSPAGTARLRWFAVALFVGLPLQAGAECSSDQAQIKLALAPEPLATRNALFSRLCADSNSELADITDPTPAMLDGRPIRLLMYFKFKATNNPHDAALHR